MPDFTITGAVGAPNFNPNSMGKNKDSVLTATNNLQGGASITLYIFFRASSSDPWVSSTGLFTSGVSSVSVGTGNQTLGTISSSASGEYLLNPSSAPPVETHAATGGNVKINVS